MSSNIIDLNAEQVRIRPAGKSARACQHQRVVADERRRLLQCEDCARWVEPFDWVHRLAEEEIFWRRKTEEFYTLCETRRTELHQLQRQVQQFLALIDHRKTKEEQL